MENAEGNEQGYLMMYIFKIQLFLSTILSECLRELFILLQLSLIN